MLLSAVSVLVVAQSSSEIPEGLMNNPVLAVSVFKSKWKPISSEISLGHPHLPDVKADHVMRDGI